MQSFKYVEPSSIKEAVAILERYGSSAKVLSGGTDLINHIHMGKCAPLVVVQIRRIRELSSEIRQTEEGIEIGALATLTDIAENPIIKTYYSALAEAAIKVGSKQVRNRATLVGNICNASPAADTAPALLVYDAVVNIVGLNGSKQSIPIEHFMTGPGKTVLTNFEIVEKIIIPTPRRTSSSTYVKLSRREGVDLAIVGVAAYIDNEGTCKLAFGAVAPKAYRAYEAEAYLRRFGLTRSSIEHAAKEAVKDANPISDLRASREYRLAMIEVLTRNALSALLKAKVSLEVNKHDR